MSPDDLPPYTPCKCVGPCRPATCSCIQSNNWCEKFCACVSCKTRDCTFSGCSCLTQCRTERCPCLTAGRECDPDICKNCTTTALGTAPPNRACCNMGLRLRKHAHIYMGLSSVSGWGAFLGRAAAKDDFLGEYVGEMLSQAEADRRGKAYDRSNNSYLFGVNSAWVLDARDRGNNLRFANHRSQPNCQTRVLMVDGDHRVGLFAVKDIAEGEELFYNYRYDLDNAPDWAIC
ncbi:enhancer of zeste 2 [Scenedesmus sp. NREL 46B-D3]|nr:enhancer of zeste 2 [Scenedesmus sp. NREL 46B-D3]